MTKKELQEIKETGIYGYIYCVSNIHNDKKYVGQIIATKGKDRLAEHYRQAHYGYYPVTKFRNALRKYPLEDFNAETIDVAYSQEELNQKEVYWIEQYNSFKKGYNSTIGGDVGCPGYKHTEEAKRKISENNKKRKLSETAKAKIGAANKYIHRNNEKSKPIDMYDYYGNFLKSFPSIRECMRFLNLKDDADIRRCLKKPGTRSLGFCYTEHKEENIMQTKSDDEILKMKQKRFPITTKIFKATNEKTKECVYLIGWKEIVNFSGYCSRYFEEMLQRNNNRYKGYVYEQIKPYEMPNDYPLALEH